MIFSTVWLELFWSPGSSQTCSMEWVSLTIFLIMELATLRFVTCPALKLYVFF